MRDDKCIVRFKDTGLYNIKGQLSVLVWGLAWRGEHLDIDIDNDFHVSHI